jgi:hypothetical protein
VALTMAIKVVPITDADALRVGDFLHTYLNPNVTAEHWARSIDVPWTVDRPNGGFMLLDGDDIVGANLAFYSERVFDGRTERFCNLGAWCVLPQYRFHSIRLLRALLAQDGYHFTDLSPSGNVVGVNERLGFHSLDTAGILVPAFPAVPGPRRGRVSADPAVIDRTLTGAELELYRDHVETAAARHLVLVDGDEWCYVVFRKDRRWRVRAFASILHVSNPALFRRMTGRLGRHLLVHHGIFAMLVEDRISPERPRLAVPLKSPRRKMYRSPRLEPAQIDYLYSELVCVSW